MKKIILALVAFNILMIAPAHSCAPIKKIPKTEIKKVIKEYNKAMKNHDIEKIKTFYDENYVSSDGFNFENMSEMLEKTYSAYEDMKYKTKINSITAYDNWALVQLSDYTKGVINPSQAKELKKDKRGNLEGKSVYNLYLTKENGSWKIIKDEILIEETSLKYGLANKIDMNLITPYSIKNGQDYDISLKIKKPKDVMALASISREEIVYPPSDYAEKFRKISEFGELERIVTANDKNLNEYAIASVGLAKLSVNQEERKAKIEILGIGYVMKRINMDNSIKKEEI